MSWLGLGGQMVKNLPWLACKFDLDQSERKSSQVNASARKPWPNGVASSPKFSTCIYLRLRLSRALCLMRIRTLVALKVWILENDNVTSKSRIFPSDYPPQFTIFTAIIFGVWNMSKQYGLGAALIQSGQNVLDGTTWWMMSTVQNGSNDVDFRVSMQTANFTRKTCTLEAEPRWVAKPEARFLLVLTKSICCFRSDQLL